MHADADRPPSTRSAVPDQLEAEAELAGVLHVVGGDVLDALVGDLVEVHRRVERQPREDRHLRRGVLAVDVVGRVGLGVAERAAPRPARRRRRRRSRPSRLRMKFVVPLTIPWMRSTCGAGQRLLQHADRRHDAGDRGLEAQLHAVLARGRPQLLAVLAEQLLVGGDDVLAGAHRAQRRSSRAGSSPPMTSTIRSLPARISSKSPRAARQDAGDLGPQPGDALDLVGALGEQRRRTPPPTVPWPSRPMRKRLSHRRRARSRSS